MRRINRDRYIAVSFGRIHDRLNVRNLKKLIGKNEVEYPVSPPLLQLYFPSPFLAQQNSQFMLSSGTA